MQYQYTIQVQRKNARSFHINTYDYLDVALIQLEDYIKQDKHYKRAYYVYNDFFVNKYPEETAVSRYKLLVRQVGNWCDFHNLNNYIENSIDNEILM